MGTLGRYQLEKKLAVGGMAEVWLARSEGPGGFSKRVVVKRVLPHLVSEPRFLEMFLHEAALVAQLDHPHVVQLFAFGEEEGAPYLALEYVDGPSLAAVRRQARADREYLPPALCARVVADACAGLAHAHDFRHPRTGEPLGLVHRDVSPDNLLLSRAGAVKVADFGIARSGLQQHRTKTGVVKGKLPYVTPEQLDGQPLDRRVDVYALGVVLYELLVLERPFKEKAPAQLMRQIVSEPPPPLQGHREDVPEAIESIIRRALEKDRDRRFPDCREMQRALEAWMAEVRPPFGTRDVARWIADHFPAEEQTDMGTAPAAKGEASRQAEAQTVQVPPVRREGSPAADARGSKPPEETSADAQTRELPAARRDAAPGGGTPSPGRATSPGEAKTETVPAVRREGLPSGGMPAVVRASPVAEGKTETVPAVRRDGPTGKEMPAADRASPPGEERTQVVTASVRGASRGRAVK